MVDIDIVYEGELHCAATHRPSGAHLSTDAPIDNHGRGESFSPTDLVGAALGTCMSTVMGILARARDYPIAGTTVHVKKSMTKAPPRRIAELAVVVTMPEAARSLPEDARKALEHAANTCPVRLSLLDAIAVPVRFDWPT